MDDLTDIGWGRAPAAIRGAPSRMTRAWEDIYPHKSGDARTIIMKVNKTPVLASLAIAGLLGVANLASAQTVVKETTTTTALGTISEFSPDTIVIKSETSTDPVRYYYNNTTTYVDETGAVVAVKSVKSGLPVTVYYTKVGDRNVVTKVLVRKAVPAPTVEETKTTTTTTTTGK